MSSEISSFSVFQAVSLLSSHGELASLIPCPRLPSLEAEQQVPSSGGQPRIRTTMRLPRLDPVNVAFAHSCGLFDFCRSIDAL